MKVLYWTEAFWPHIGGVEVWSAELLPRLQARGYDFTVVTSHTDDETPDETCFEGIPVHRFDFRRALAIRNLSQIVAIQKRLLALKRSVQPDLVHINYCDPSVFFHLRTAEACPAPDMLTIQAFLADVSPEESLQVRTLRSVDWVVAPSETILRDARKQVPEIGDRSSAIYPASVDLPELERAPLSFEAPRLLCLGRLVYDKGFDVALDAFASVAARFPTASMVVSGDGPARAELERQAQELGLADRVEFTGWITDWDVPRKVLELINTATLVVMPSRWREPFGLVALQAAQMARPIVASRTGGLQEIVADGETGLLAEPLDSKAFANGIAFLLTHPHHAERMGLAARARAEKLFGWDRCVNDYDALYRQLIAQ